VTALRAGALTALARADMFVFGIVMALVGAIVPTLTERLPLTLGMIGTLFLFMNFAMLVVSLGVGLVIDRYGMKVPLAAGAWLVAAALVMIAAAESYPILLAAVFLLGLGGGALNAAANTLIADLHDDAARKAAALNMLGVFFGFGALVLPFSIGALTRHVGVPALLLSAAALCAVVGLFAAAAVFPTPKHGHSWPLAHVSRFIRVPLIVTMALVLFFQSGNEFLLGGYIATFLTRELALSVTAASYALAGYWAAIMLARAVLSRLLLRVSAGAVLMGGAIAAAGGAILIAFAGTAHAAVAAVLITGLAFAGIFPTALGIVGNRFPEHSGTIFGLLFTIALYGGMTMPWVAGHIAERAGIRAVFLLASANFIAIAVLGRLVGRR
jgi:MFS transporter, FHS family, glucose/mannose:H+ symporter